MRIIFILTVVMLFTRSIASAGLYAPPAGQPGSTAIANTSPLFVEWGSGFQDLVRGPLDVANPGGGLASFGSGAEALGPADGNSSHTVSLGDGGQITLSFARAITDASGFDFAVFENSFSATFLELAFVEVSSNGTDFVRFPAVSLTPATTQVGSFGTLDATNLDNLAGKYIGGFGTPFDLSEVAGLDSAVDVGEIHFVRLVDVVGTIDSLLGNRDSLGNLVNDPYPTAFASGGFDLDGVGVINAVPEPAGFGLAAMVGAIACWFAMRRR